MTYEQTRSEVYEYVYDYQTATVDEIVDELDRNANYVYGICKHLVWDGYFGREGAETFTLVSDVPGLCPECGADAEYGEVIERVCPECGWEETWTCGSCGATEHDSMELHEVEVDVTCESVYIVPTDDGSGFAFDHDEFREIVKHFDDSEYTKDLSR